MFAAHFLTLWKVCVQQRIVDPFDEVFGSRGSSPDRPPRQQQDHSSPEVTLVSLLLCYEQAKHPILDACGLHSELAKAFVSPPAAFCILLEGYMKLLHSFSAIKTSPSFRCRGGTPHIS